MNWGLDKDVVCKEKIQPFPCLETHGEANFSLVVVSSGDLEET